MTWRMIFSILLVRPIDHEECTGFEYFCTLSSGDGCVGYDQFGILGARLRE